jgi:hypothetical protein
LSPLNRVRIAVLFYPTVIATSIVLWMCWYFNVSWSYVHWWIFGFIWFSSAIGALQGATLHEGLRYMGRKNKSDDVLNYIERE